MPRAVWTGFRGAFWTLGRLSSKGSNSPWRLMQPRPTLRGRWPAESPLVCNSDLALCWKPSSPRANLVTHGLKAQSKSGFSEEQLEGREAVASESWDRARQGCGSGATCRTFLGELGKVLLQVRDTLPLQVAVKLEPGDSLFFREAGSREQPAAADHLLQEPVAHWRGDAGLGREAEGRLAPGRAP